MKLAVFSDVHGNLPALDAVIAHARANGVQEFWDLGDSVGYSPYPNEVLALFRRYQVKSVRGNYDQKVLLFPRLRRAWRKEKAPAKYFSFRWASRQLSLANQRYLGELPDSRRIRRCGLRFFLVHASPLHHDEVLGPHTSRKRLCVLARAAKADIVLCGHSHVYFHRKAAKTLFINPGSVGRSFEGQQDASYVILTLGRKRLKARRYRLKYDLTPCLRRMHKEKFPAILIKSIRLGFSIDQLQERCRTQKNRIVSQARQQNRARGKM